MRKGRILIVEDNFFIAEGIRNTLAEAGYEVIGMAGDTESAEQLAIQQGADLAIVSMKLEVDVDGVRTASYLQSQFGMGILITTGFNEAVVHQWVGNPTSWPFLRKPFSETELLTSVSACLAELQREL
jgi:response regulator NasT